MSTETTIYCARHPREETGITCARCGTPICPRCMVVTPVGMKCPSCGTGGGTTLTQIGPAQLLLAGITALIAGVIAAFIGGIGFFVIFISLPYGYFAGMVILKASGMKRGRKMEMLAGIGMVLGALSVRLLPAIMLAAMPETAGSALRIIVSSIADPLYLLAVGISTAGAVSRIRYL